MKRSPTALTALMLASLASPSVLAQSTTPAGMPPPTGMSLAASAAMRFPQPVRIGDLIGRTVQKPVESQDHVGTVRQVVKQANGTLQVVIQFGGILGIGTRLIAVPVDAMVLVGQVMEVVAYTPAQLRALPTFIQGSATPLANDTMIQVGLAKPSH